MNRIVPLVIIGILIVSGFGVQAVDFETSFKQTTQVMSERITVDITSLQLIEKTRGVLEVSFGSDTDVLMNPGQPMLPRVIRTFELPFGVTNIQVIAQPSDIQEIHLSGEIRVSPAPLPRSPQAGMVSGSKDMEVYGSNDWYPHTWYGTHMGCGLNGEGYRVTFLTVNVFPVRYQPLSGTIYVAEDVDLMITYDMPEQPWFPQTAMYDLVIITPEKFTSELQRFVDHKNSFGVETLVKTTEDIYSEYTGVDKPEQIKYFIKDAIETMNITHVLLFGGLKTILYAKPKDDQNHGATWWYVPVRYSNFQFDGGPGYNFTSGEPNYLTDLYYADVYRYNNVTGAEFDDWDSNDNGVFAEWSGTLRDELDLYPDVAFGRLAVRNTREARDVITKIINYEKQPANPSWFKKIIAISGDGFLDQQDWNIQWNITSVPEGEYTIHAQSSNPDNDLGPVDEIHITIDRAVATNITFNHDDHLNPAIQGGYPALPITEIVSISNNNTLGNTDFTLTPSDRQAYCNDLYWWANISFVDNVLIIRGKSYDPQPYGNLTDLEVWITDSNGSTVFSDTRLDMELYYEGEWVVGEKLLRGRGGALVYMPSDFATNSVFTSNGKWVDMADVIEEYSAGYGLAYFSGHGSPGWWGDHYPGIPGNRAHGQVAGLVVTQMSLYFPFIQSPVLPMRKLTNTDKLPVVCVGGCHNSQFNVTVIPTVMNRFKQNWMNTYGTPVPECWGWYMVKLPKTGAIATMGNTGYGWGSEGDVCTIGTGDGWINTEFFRQYGEEGQDILGMAYIQAISSYVTHHKTFELDYWRYDYGWDGIDEKTVEQWALLGDPSLMIGGYP
ncbi:MAG: peptidase C25 [Candidatus Thermoplasmatota archaeon]|nr:peptidase C25 [Candidatus Thermoplasmatota archaeon]